MDEENLVEKLVKLIHPDHTEEVGAVLLFLFSSCVCSQVVVVGI